MNHHHHLSQLSSSFFAGPEGDGDGFLIAEVPTALGLLFPASAKLSQKSFLLSSIGACRYDPVELLPSTKRLKPSAAPFAPVCAPFATWAAVIRACAAKSVSANYSMLATVREYSTDGEYLSSSRLYVSLIDSLGRLPHRRSKPSKALCKCSYWIFLQIIKAW
jgi:hypothetical protein